MRAQRPREVSRAGRMQLRGPCPIGLQSPADFTFVSRACRGDRSDVVSRACEKGVLRVRGNHYSSVTVAFQSARPGFPSVVTENPEIECRK